MIALRGEGMHRREAYGGERAVEAYLARKALSVGQLVSALRLGPDEIAFASGSVADGLGDERSDIDIFVITDESGFEARRMAFDSERANQQRRLEFGILYIEIGGVEFDVEFHKYEKFQSLFEALVALKPIGRQSLWSSFRSLGAFDRDEALELLNRFRISYPLANQPAYEVMRRSFDEDAFRAWNLCFCLMECEDFIKGTRRSLKERDEENAYLKLCNLVDRLADAVLFAEGDGLDRWKWRLPKLRRSAESRFVSLYTRIRIPEKLEDLPAFVEAQLRQCVDCHADLKARTGLP